MSFWSVMNYVVWAVNAVIILFFILDVIKIEKNNQDKKK